MPTLSEKIQAIKNEKIRGALTAERLTMLFDQVVEEIEAGGGGSPEVLTEYPTTDASKAGQRFIYKGNEWVYNYEINGVKCFAGLDIGVPWPVKGYKEYSAVLVGGNTLIESGDFDLNWTFDGGEVTAPLVSDGTVFVHASMGGEFEGTTNVVYGNHGAGSVNITRLEDGVFSGNVMAVVNIKEYPPTA